MNPLREKFENGSMAQQAKMLTPSFGQQASRNWQLSD
jgi:hypothetical protein